MTKEITINGEIFKVNSISVSPKYVKLGDETTTLDGNTHIEKRALKRSISITKTDVESVETARLLAKVYSSIYTTLVYTDPLTNTEQTRLFILQNDPTASTKIWKQNMKYYEAIQLDFLEKGAE